MISDLDKTSNVIYADTLLFVSVDMYLGEQQPFYNIFQPYFRREFTPEHFIVDAAHKIAEWFFPVRQMGRSFLDQMIAEGKKMYVIDCLLPTISDREKMAYTAHHIQWLQNNERNVWHYFIKEKILYSTHPNLKNRFLKPAPFSKFYLEQDNQTPPKVGVWVGWQIIRKFMREKNISLQEMLAYDSDEILRISKYKP